MNIKQAEKSILLYGFYHEINNGRELLIEKNNKGYFGIIRNGINRVESLQSNTIQEIKSKIEQIH